MNIGFDIRPIIGKPMFGTIGPTGVPGYTIHLLKEMIAQGGDHHFYLFSNSLKKPNTEAIRDLLDKPNVHLVVTRMPNKIFDHLAHYIGYPRIDTTIISFQEKNNHPQGLDVYITPHINITPLSSNTKRVLIIHDLSFEIYPEFFSMRKRYWHWVQHTRKSCERAHKIVTVSENTRNDLLALYNLDKNRVQYIPPGQGLDLEILVKNFDEVKSTYNLPDNYFLFVGTLEPRKNIESIINAYDMFVQQTNGNAPDLVIAGGKGWLYNRIFRTIKTSDNKEKIHVLGFIDAEDKNTIIKHANAFVFPSHYEGIGFPALEALAQGTPVITSHVSSLPEMIENQAILIDPYNTNDIARALSEVIKREESPPRHFNKETFSWSEVAKKHLDMLAELT